MQQILTGLAISIAFPMRQSSLCPNCSPIPGRLV